MIKFFLNKGSKIENLVVVIGPCISVKNYEIKKDFNDIHSTLMKAVTKRVAVKMGVTKERD